MAGPPFSLRRPYLLAVTLWQPWAWAFRHAGKRLENRDWRPSEIMHKLDPWYGQRVVLDRGDLLAIHAGSPKTFDDHGHESLADLIECGKIETTAPLPKRRQDFTFSAVDGVGTYWGAVDRVREDSTQNIWRADTRWGLVLDNYWPLPTPVPCSGCPLLWPIPDDDLHEVVHQWSKALDLSAEE